jgi:FimV-like protein
VADTYGWMLVSRGQRDRGVQVLTQAARAAPDNAEIRLHLGKALLQAGDRSGAKRELEVVASRGTDEQRSEAAGLLRAL